MFSGRGLLQTQFTSTGRLMSVLVNPNLTLIRPHAYQVNCVARVRVCRPVRVSRSPSTLCFLSYLLKLRLLSSLRPIEALLNFNRLVVDSIQSLAVCWCDLREI